MKKILACILSFLFLIVPALSENASPEEVGSDLYDRIEMSARKDELDLKYACTETEENYFLYENEVMCVFYESGRLQAKLRAFESVLDVAPVADIPLDKLPSYKQGMKIDEVTGAFGCEGFEIMKINLADEDDAGVRRVLVWKTETGVHVQALFELDDNEWVLFAIAEGKEK